MGPYQVPKSPEDLQIPLEHGQAEHPPSDETSSSAPEINDDVDHLGDESLSSASLSTEIDSMIVEQGSCENMDTSSTDPTLLVLLETSDEDSADDMLIARWSPILFRMSAQEQGSSDAEMPAEMGPDLALSRAPNDTNRMRHLTDTSNEQESGPESDLEVSIITDGGYMADIESGPEIDYTAYTTEELGQREMLAICAEQRESNGLARLSLFRIPPKNCGICPICKINNK